MFNSKRSRILLAGAGSLMALGLTAGPALAATGPAPGTQPGNAPILKLTGGNAVTYTDPFFGPVQCNEVHHANAHAGQNFDSVSCQSTTGLPLTNVTPGEVSTVGWNTDFSNVTPAEPQGVLSFTVSADGLSYTAIANY